MTFAVVTGGGTAGHVLPALAIADALAARGHDRAEIRYVGTTRGVEARLLPPTGYPFTLLDVVGLQRSFSRRNLAFVPKLCRATWQARRLMRAWRPRVVVNVGGYASVPATIAARLARVPVVVVSYDRRPGLVSRLAARGAAACAVAFEGSALPRAQLTGAPVRSEVLAVDRVSGRQAARAALGLPDDRFVVAVVGGSLGAQQVNAIVQQVVDALAARSDLAVYHVVGERNLAGAAPGREGAQGILYRVIGYEDRMPLVLAAADLLVCRAGAGTIAEVAAVGIPAIIVPWPDAAENHQVDNARTLADHGAAIMIEQRDLSAGRLVDEIERLQHDPDALAQLATRARAAGAVHRSGALPALIEEVAAR